MQGNDLDNPTEAASVDHFVSLLRYLKYEAQLGKNIEKTRRTYNDLSQNVPMIATFRFLGICSFRRDGNGKSSMMPSKMILRTGTDSPNSK